ncbi:hypothetical protein [Streptomyces sp. F001]|uniref:hypothetical protein n=1 Tax=Streptomyces sp. F001 TaxID=1510026 RepID=UPI001F0E3737|nr:hypothetical protein [Streptomyces sp. F001]
MVQPVVAEADVSAGSLIVVGHRTADQSVDLRTGPVTHTAIHHVGCPVAVVPHA